MVLKSVTDEEGGLRLPVVLSYVGNSNLFVLNFPTLFQQNSKRALFCVFTKIKYLENCKISRDQLIKQLRTMRGQL